MTPIITYHQVYCPTCKQHHHIQVDMTDLTKTAVFYCDGCDRQYAVQVVLLPRTQVFELTPAGSSEPIDYDPRLDYPAPAVQ